MARISVGGLEFSVRQKNSNENKIQSPHAGESFEKNLKPRFRWDKEGINNLIQCMLSYNPETGFEGKDLNADKVSSYFQIFLLRDKYNKTLIFCFAWCNLKILMIP